MLYDANERPIESTLRANSQEEENGYEHIPSFNFPPPTPKPEWFDRKLNEIGGFVDPGTNNIPKYRVVWGMDPELTQFAMGEVHIKYPMIVDTIHTTLGYNVINTKRGTKKFLKPDVAHKLYLDEKTGQLSKNVRPGELLIPVVKEEIRELGTPLWIVEQCVPPEAFGSAEAWESERLLINPENPLQFIDALGDYPSQGAYIHWFDLVDHDENGREMYRELDEGALEIIRINHDINVARRESFKYDTVAKIRERREAKFESDWAAFDKELTRDILDVKANRKFSITPKG